MAKQAVSWEEYLKSFQKNVKFTNVLTGETGTSGIHSATVAALFFAKGIPSPTGGTIRYVSHGQAEAAGRTPGDILKAATPPSPIPTPESINLQAMRKGEAERRRRSQRRGRASTILTEISGAPLGGRRTILG